MASALVPSRSKFASNNRPVSCTNAQIITPLHKAHHPHPCSFPAWCPSQRRSSLQLVENGHNVVNCDQKRCHWPQRPVHTKLDHVNNSSENIIKHENLSRTNRPETCHAGHLRQARIFCIICYRLYLCFFYLFYRIFNIFCYRCPPGFYHHTHCYLFNFFHLPSFASSWSCQSQHHYRNCTQQFLSSHAVSQGPKPLINDRRCLEHHNSCTGLHHHAAQSNRKHCKNIFYGPKKFGLLKSIISLVVLIGLNAPSIEAQHAKQVSYFWICFWILYNFINGIN